MKLLFDTHALLWWFLGAPHLTHTVRDAIQSEASIAGLLPIPHKDAFDRLLIARAQTKVLVLISDEAIFDSFGVIRLW